MSASRSALVISAHAADFVWRCGEAIALHAAKRYNVTVRCLSYGERDSGGQSGGRDCKYAEGYQSIFPRTVDEL